MPKVGGMVVSPSQYAMQNGTSYGSQSSFRAHNGSAGVGKQWHHIVEQRLALQGQMPRELIYNTFNTIAIDTQVHIDISAYYSSPQSFTGGLTFRAWLTPYSYDYQFSMGLLVMNQVMEKYR